MAKEQNLSLNPTKISGVCGRLMCCLKNEEETYEYLNSRLPGVGDSVTTATGQVGEVQSVNVLRQKVKVLIEVDDEKELHEYDVDELRFRPRRKNVKLSAKELEELEGLADEELAGPEKQASEKPEQEKREGRRENRENRDQNRENKDQGQQRERRDRGRNRDRREGGKDREKGSEVREGREKRDPNRENKDQNREIREPGSEHRDPGQRRNHHYKNRNKKDRGEKTNAGEDRQPSESKS